MGGGSWLSRLRTKYKNCYDYINFDIEEECILKHTRVNWADPINHNNWLDLIDLLYDYVYDKDEYDPFWKIDNNILQDPKFQMFKPILDKIKNEDDLYKIIFEDNYVIKQGDRCSIENWKEFIKNDWTEYVNTLSVYSIKFPYVWDTLRLLDKMKIITKMGRYRMDVYALLRIFRKDDPKNRFKNVIYHAGESHTMTMMRMLENLNFKVIRHKITETAGKNVQDNNCMRINLIEDIVF